MCRNVIIRDNEHMETVLKSDIKLNLFNTVVNWLNVHYE